MRRGIKKVRMELALLFMLHNIMKVAPIILEKWESEEG
jgi:hypothetical protein